LPGNAEPLMLRVRADIGARTLGAGPLVRATSLV
jgi:hypothetical protein